MTSQTMLPTQLVVFSQLAEGSYPGMKILAKNARMEDVKRFLDSITNDRIMIEYANAILVVSIAANPELYARLIKEDGEMNETVERVLSKQFTQKWNDGIAKGRAEGEAIGREKGKEEDAIEMLKDDMPEDKIAKYTQLTFERIKELKKTLLNSAAVL